MSWNIYCSTASVKTRLAYFLFEVSVALSVLLQVGANDHNKKNIRKQGYLPPTLDSHEM